jgi:hypothetical protein
MRKILAAVAFAGAALVLCLPSAPAFAQATRTWVSGVGDDANPCSRTAPCKTFAGAISKTAPGGEIDALDPGGFGALTITKSITLDGGGGQVASILIAGTNGLVIAAGASDVVIIRNLRLDGLLGAGNTNAGINGIRFISGGMLKIEKVEIFGFSSNCIDLEPGNTARVFIFETYCENNGGSTLTNAGILIRPGGGASMNVTADRFRSAFSSNGIFMDGSGGGGNTNLSLTNSVLSGAPNNGIAVSSTGATFSAVVTNSALVNNGNTGAATAGGSSRLALGGNTIFGNVVGVSGGTTVSFKNNQIFGNNSDGTPITAVNSGGNILN